MSLTNLVVATAVTCGAALGWMFTVKLFARRGGSGAVRIPHTRKKPYWLQLRLSRLKAALKFAIIPRPHCQDFFEMDTEQLEWEGSERDGYQIKRLLHDPETGVRALLIRYPAGSVTAKHIHPCGHGMYVLKGELETSKGRFAPNSFVWFPEGEAMEHGASSKGDTVVLLLNNKPWDLTYL
jgi:quercetin dioxygenase-like cupin family protein